ncbi:hypothetical protein VitviT2T_021628 [Vitis vinifera]|uniref:Protein transport protein SEC23 n=1 Tax=Vitis vinifera TaxID=29760 RepID=A0ABY9DAC5_VITVI|nr:hypothetical protein VitviT2T_021628 [Vitis vinifera]
MIQLCSRFGDYRKGNPSSFSLSPRFSLFPQFINHVLKPTFLGVAAFAADRILLLDSYFIVVVFHGATIAQ